MAKSRKKKKEKPHKELRKHMCPRCKRVHSGSVHKHHGKGSFKKVRTVKSYKAATKTKRRTTKRKTKRRRR